MYIILGGTGHVCSSVATTLLEKGKEVTVITHIPQKAPEWEQKGANVMIVDVYDSDKLHAVLKNGERFFC
jgi:NAD(P)H dehydrogenase (quinone)